MSAIPGVGVLEQGEGGGVVRLELLIGGGASLVVSIAAAFELSVSARGGVVIEMRERAPSVMSITAAF
jgi:hypothetical protein